MHLQVLTLAPTRDSYRQAEPCLATMLQGDAASAYLPAPTTAAGTAALTQLTPYLPHLAADTTLVVATSGTTGDPKYAQLGAPQLRASATATHQVLGGPGAWLLPLPPHHIAGMQVLLRSLAAGYEPTLQDTRGGFTLDSFATLTHQLLERTPDTRHYTSLVPTQLHKILTATAHSDPAGHAALQALTCFDAILVGGAALAPELLRQATDAGARLVRTYGASETAGGCVYDGVPLPGARVEIEDATGRIWLGGDTIATGYLNKPHHVAWQRPGWFRTDDHGHWDTTHTPPRLHVDGRLDDAISSGGLTIFPHVVENVLATHPAIAQVVVLGRPDERLGEHVAAVIVPTTAPQATPDFLPTLAELRTWVMDAGLPATAAPRELIVRTSLPLKGIGKIDRRALQGSLPETAPPA